MLLHASFLASAAGHSFQRRTRLYLAFLWGYSAFVGTSAATPVTLGISPPILPQTPGQPPLAQLVFDRVLDLSGTQLFTGAVGRVAFTRNGDFNNPTTAVDPNGAPEEGIAIYTRDPSTGNRLDLLAFQPGIAGTIHDTTDDPANRQFFEFEVPHEFLRAATDLHRQLHYTVVIGRSVDDLTFFEGRFSLEVGPRGDYNQDGVVNAADYTVWRDTLGQVGVLLPADGDANGMVDEGDYLVWKENFGTTITTELVAVPEPQAAWLGTTGLVLLWGYRVRFRRRTKDADGC